MTDTTRADAVLEALSLERQAASARSFEDLFLRFQRRVACETLTRPAGDPGPFDAQAFFAGWVDDERGLVGEERTRAFEWLAAECGFEVTAAPGECRRPWGGGASAHRAVIATIDGRRVLADAGFPLPVLLPLDPPVRAIPTALGDLSSRVREDGRTEISCDARGEETDLLRLEVPGTRPAGHLEHEKDAAFALRVLDDRVLFWRKGRMTILDSWSRLEYPLPASERAAIEKIFALELEGFLLSEEPLPDAPEPATLSVFHRSPVAPEEARERLGREALPLILVTSREERVEAASGGSLITIRATLADVPPAGPGEAVRKTLVFHLVSELFERARGGGRTG